MKKVHFPNYSSIVAFASLLFVIACGDDSGTSPDSSETNYKESSSSKKLSSSSSKRLSSSSRVLSSSSSAEFEYLTKSKTMKFTLKYYRQTVCSMDGKSKKNCNYADGNPNVSFTIDFIQPGGSKTTFSTKESINKKWFEYDDLGEWEGKLSFTTNVPALTSTIKVCPKVVDVDFVFDDDVSSGYCYSKSNVGQLPNKEVVEQSDTRADKYKLEWEWYLY